MFSTYPSVFKLSSDDIINEITFSESSFSFISWKELRFWVKVFFRFSRSGWLPLCLIVQSSSRIVSPELRSMSAGLGISPDIYNTPVETLDLSARTLNCLKRAGINRVGEVIAMPEGDLLKIRNFGRKSLDELFDVLAERNMLPQS